MLNVSVVLQSLLFWKSAEMLRLGWECPVMGMSPAGVSSVQEVQQPACVGGVLRALLWGQGGF